MDAKIAAERIAENEWSILVVASTGEIQDLIGLTSVPSAELISKVAQRYKDSGFRCLERCNLPESELISITKNIADTLSWAKKQNLKPGVNIPKGIGESGGSAH